MDEIHKGPPLLTLAVKPKNDLLRNQKKLKLIKELCNEIQHLEDKMLLVKDIETLKYICNKLENSVTKKDKLDKKAVVIEAYKQAFGESNIDVEFLAKEIYTLWDNKKIKKMSVLKRYLYPVINFFLKRFL